VSCSAATARGAVLAGDVAEQGSPVGRCWAMAKSPGAAVSRDHHLVGGPVRRPGPPGAGDRGEEQAAVLQQFETPCWPATLPSRNHRWEHCWAEYPGGTAGRNHHLVGGPVRKAVALLDNGALGGKGRFSLQSCNN
jgi:hypothetical protein